MISVPLKLCHQAEEVVMRLRILQRRVNVSVGRLKA
jgi:hypothetical protein